MLNPVSLFIFPCNAMYNKKCYAKVAVQIQLLNYRCATLISFNLHTAQSDTPCVAALRRFPAPDVTYTAKHLWNDCRKTTYFLLRGKALPNFVSCLILNFPRTKIFHFRAWLWVLVKRDICNSTLMVFTCEQCSFQKSVPKTV